jgi:hypothetical protein
MKIVAGRPFSKLDVEAVVINERAALYLWKGETPLGDELWLDGEERPRVVIGIAKDSRILDLSQEPGPQIYLPYARPYRNQAGPDPSSFVIRCNGPCSQTIRHLTPQLEVGSSIRVSGLQDLVDSQTAPQRLRTTIIGTYAAVGFILALVGTYSLVSYLTMLRRYEMGVRIALGAQPKDVIGHIVMQGIKATGIGVLLGIFACLAVARFLESFLWGIKPLDPSSIAATVLLVLSGATVASLLPAMALSRRNPGNLLAGGP